MTKIRLQEHKQSHRVPESLTHRYIFDNPLWFAGHFLQIVLFLIKSDEGKRSSSASVCGLSERRCWC